MARRPQQGEDKPSPLLCLRSGSPGSSIVGARLVLALYGVAITSESHSPTKSKGPLHIHTTAIAPTTFDELFVRLMPIDILLWVAWDRVNAMCHSTEWDIRRQRFLKITRRAMAGFGLLVGRARSLEFDVLFSFDDRRKRGAVLLSRSIIVPALRLA